MSLIVEDGSGLQTANSYVSLADADAFYGRSPYSTTWDASADSLKEKALMLATMVIDASMQFNGYKKEVTQALQWPRRECVDPDRQGGQQAGAYYSAADIIRGFDKYFEDDRLPKVLVDATCLFAQDLLSNNTLTDPDDKGIASLEIFQAMKVVFAKGDTRQVASVFVQQMLAKLGTFMAAGGGGGGNVRLTRV